MAESTLKSESLEVLGECMTNPTPGSTHDAKVEYRHLWSFAQEKALIAVSDKDLKTGCYELITDPERRARRIAAHYADLYFESAKASKNKMKFQWPALAAFVVKDIVYAFEYARVEVLQRNWTSFARAARGNMAADLFSTATTGNSPYDHALRTYAALAKGNIWLFMDIYPFYWFFLKFGVNSDTSLNKQRLAACLPHRSWDTYQRASKEAVEQLPFGPDWLDRLSARLKADPIYKKGGQFFNTPTYGAGGAPGSAYAQHQGKAFMAHQYCRTNVKYYDNGYRMPASGYWGKFTEAYYVMGSEHAELEAVVRDKAGLAGVLKVRKQQSTKEVAAAYQHLIDQHAAAAAGDKNRLRAKELAAVAFHEQIRVLQPLIYDDPRLKKTMDTNHYFSRLTNGRLTPKFQVVFSAEPSVKDPHLKAVFDEPENFFRSIYDDEKSLPDQTDRMEYVEQIAAKFNFLMQTRPAYVEGQLQAIRKWKNA